MNLSTIKKESTAAKKFCYWLQKKARGTGGNPAYVFLWSPEESKRRGYGNNWTVCWEEGPHGWAGALSMGESMYAHNYGSIPAEIDLLGSENWHCEPYNSFVLCFYRD